MTFEFLSDIKRMMQKSWIEQLYREHEQICYAYGLKLLKPLIELDDAQSRWGQWDPATRVLKISKHLIEHFNWDTVVGILKHEMAHQIVTEVFQTDDGHGPLFKKACKLVGVPDAFASATAEIDLEPGNKLPSQLTEHEQVLQRKVERLMAVAQSSNEHEAYLAMERVQQLFSKYNFERILNNQQSDYDYVIINHRKKRIENTQRIIGSILCAHYFVTVVHSDLYDATELTSHKVIELLGTKQNLKMAEYVYYFLLNTTESLWKDFQKQTAAETKQKNSYQSGVLIGFRDKLDQSAKAAKPQYLKNYGKDLHSLIKLEDSKLEEFKAERFPKLVTVRGGSSRFYKDAFDEGCQAGRKLVIHHAVTEQGGARGRFLNPSRS